MHIIAVQILSLLCLFVSMVCCFLLPCWWTSRKPDSFGSARYQLGISFANCLSGGVFLATFFVGLMPEVRELLQDIEAESKFPLTEFVIFLGFLVALAIEQLALQCQEKKSHYTCIPLETEEDAKNKDSADSKCSTAYDSDCNSKSASVLLKAETHDDINKHAHSGHSHTDIVNYIKGESGIRLGMLLVSLGVHSIFEGLALGLQTNVPFLINLVIGVALHELLVAFAMGVNVSRHKLPKNTTFKLGLIFSATIPVGQILGLLVGHYRSKTAETVSAVLQGLAAGTFIHVTFFEVIPAEFQEPGHRLCKVFFLGLGFMLFLVCTVIMEKFLLV